MRMITGVPAANTCLMLVASIGSLKVATNPLEVGFKLLTVKVVVNAAWTEI